MENKPKPVLISYSPKQNVREISEQNPTSVSKIRNMGWIVLGFLFMYSLFVISTFIDHVYNLGHHGDHMIQKDVPYGYSDRIELEMYQHNPEIIEGVEYKVYEIQIQDGDYYSQILRHSLLEPNSDFRRVSEFQLGHDAINHADEITIEIFHSTSSGTEIWYMSCSDITNCDEDQDGWLRDYNGRDDFYFCHCGSYYDNSIVVAVPDVMEPRSIYVRLDYDNNKVFSGILFTVVFTLGLITGKILDKRIESTYFTRTVVLLYVLFIPVNTISIF